MFFSCSLFIPPSCSFLFFHVLFLFLVLSFFLLLFGFDRPSSGARRHQGVTALEAIFHLEAQSYILRRNFGRRRSSVTILGAGSYSGKYRRRYDLARLHQTGTKRGAVEEKRIAIFVTIWVDGDRKPRVQERGRDRELFVHVIRQLDRRGRTFGDAIRILEITVETAIAFFGLWTRLNANANQQKPEQENAPSERHNRTARGRGKLSYFDGFFSSGLKRLNFRVLIPVSLVLNSCLYL